jgi:hypothetical protein
MRQRQRQRVGTLTGVRWDATSSGAQAFLAQALHQPAEATSLPP